MLVLEKNTLTEEIEKLAEQYGNSRASLMPMLQAIQAKEKETQEKVKKQKAEALKSRQKEKNW